MSTRSLVSRALQGIIRDTDIEQNFYRLNRGQRKRIEERDRVARLKKQKKQVLLKPVVLVTDDSVLLKHIFSVSKPQKRRRH